MKTLDLARCYKMLKDTKISELKENDKILVLKAMRELRPIYNNLKTDELEAEDKMKGDNHERMVYLVKKDLEHQADKTKPELTPEEIKEANLYFEKYYNSLNNYLKEIHNAEIDTSFDKISYEAFNKLMDVNDFSCEDILLLQDVLMEQ